METLPTLYLPVGKTVQIDLSSRDVIHSFWVVEFLYKKDMFPGQQNEMYFTPLKEGTYVGKCAELWRISLNDALQCKGCVSGRVRQADGSPCCQGQRRTALHGL
jgi:hypothetical protein